MKVGIDVVEWGCKNGIAEHIRPMFPVQEVVDEVERPFKCQIEVGDGRCGQCSEDRQQVAAHHAKSKQQGHGEHRDHVCTRATP